MSMYKLTCPHCVVAKPESCKHVRKIENNEQGIKYFSCLQCHKQFSIVEENAEHVVVGPEISLN